MQAQHHFFEGLVKGRQYRARVAIVTEGAKLDPNTHMLKAGSKGPWSPNSYPYKTKEERPPISSELRRQMWASFYVDTTPGCGSQGSLLESPCLGCLAQRKAAPKMLSPLLPPDVVAAHVIADAKGGPHGEDREEAWNFLPLCDQCNLDMKTQNAIDWSTTSARRLAITSHSSRCSFAFADVSSTTRTPRRSRLPSSRAVMAP